EGVLDRLRQRGFAAYLTNVTVRPATEHCSAWITGGTPRCDGLDPDTLVRREAACIGIEEAVA
ncbi:hypothetical protein, partial [Bifidobacterium bifidum]|uniref:hypothetical protein n=1 Tax=Bifidobacterium bifidum TaxID=1681 RepID=UPI001D10089E